MSLLGIDVGTSGCKAAAYGVGGGCIASAHREYPTVHPRPGWAELDSRLVLARVRFNMITAVVVCVLASGNAVSGSFLPREIQQYVEDNTKVCLLPPECQKLPEVEFTKEMDLPDSSTKVKIDFIILADTALECLKRFPQECCASGIYRVSLLKKKENSIAREGTEPEITKSISVLTQLGLGAGPDAAITRAGKTPVLLLKAWTGGNCRDCDMSIIISLDPGHMLDLVGKALTDEVPDWTDLNGGEVHLSVVYEGLEFVFPLTGPDDPSVQIFLKISKGRLVPDRSRCYSEWKSILSPNDSALSENSSPMAEAEIEHEFGMLLNKLLVDYFMGKGNTAWERFRSGLKPLLDTNGRLIIEPGLRKEGYSPEEIETYIRKQLRIGKG